MMAWIKRKLTTEIDNRNDKDTDMYLSNFCPPNEDDFKLHDRYVNFSEQIMRFSLAAIAAVWIILIATQKPEKGPLDLSANFSLKWLSVSIVSCFTLSVLMSLLHRYFAPNSMANWLAASRKISLWKESQSAGLRTNILEGLKKRKIDFWLSELSIIAASVFLFAGLILMVVLLMIL